MYAIFTRHTEDCITEGLTVCDKWAEEQQDREGTPTDKREEHYMYTRSVALACTLYDKD